MTESLCRQWLGIQVILDFEASYSVSRAHSVNVTMTEFTMVVTVRKTLPCIGPTLSFRFLQSIQNTGEKLCVDNPNPILFFGHIVTKHHNDRIYSGCDSQDKTVRSLGPTLSFFLSSFSNPSKAVRPLLTHSWSRFSTGARE